MSHIAVWTNNDGSVQRQHYRPDEIDTSSADAVVDSDNIPNKPDVNDWVHTRLQYDGEKFSYETDDPFEGLAFSESEKQKVYDAFNEGDLVKAREVVELALQK